MEPRTPKLPLGARALGSLAAGYLRLAGAATRWEFSGLEQARELVAVHSSIIFAFWHNRFSLMPLVHPLLLSGRKMAVMVSRSRDGDLLAALIGAFGFYSARGSTSRGGRAALLELARLLGSGCDVSVTPDGPRGPRYRVQEGTVALAAISGAPLIPVSFAASRCLVISGSWDHMRIPLPLGKVRVVIRPALFVPRRLDPAGREQWRLRLEESLRAADREATEVLLPRGKMSCP